MVKTIKMAERGICDVCGKERLINGSGLCNTCYTKFSSGKMNQKRRRNRLGLKCRICGGALDTKGDFMCEKCYRPRYEIAMGKKATVGTVNKKSSYYFGCMVAEEVLKSVFKNVTWMPVNNPGYDAVCGQGFKIDIKSSCFRSKTGGWGFNVNTNTIADYYLLLAFDNRESLNPLYMWLISQKEVQRWKYLSIRPSTIDKWDEYRLSIDKTVKCCDSMKGGQK